MKICLISDTHWGIRGDNIAFHNYFKESLDTFFFPILREQGIKNIIHLGDLVDKRRTINFMTARRLRNDFLEPVNNEFHMDIIVGNHDTYFKNTNDLNALDELVDGKFKNIRIITNPTTIRDYDIPLLYVPWMCEDNLEETVNAINNTDAQICLGHLELAGYEMYKGHVSDHGYDHKIFEKFDRVFTGHYHHKSDVGNVSYLGAFADFIWSDYTDPRGFHIFDTQTREITFYRNPLTIFARIEYDDLNKEMDDVVNIAHDTAGKYVKVVVKNKTNPYWFDLFIDKIEASNALDIQVVEDQISLDIGDDSDIIDEAQDTITIFKSYIGQLNLAGTKREKLEKTILELYQEAVTLE